MSGWAIEGTKLAIDRADVGVVDVSVNEVRHLSVGVHGQASLMCGLHQFVEWCLIIQENGLLV